MGCEVSDYSWKFTYAVEEPKKEEDEEAPTFGVHVELHEVEENSKYAITVTNGSFKSFDAFDNAYTELLEKVNESN